MNVMRYVSVVLVIAVLAAAPSSGDIRRLNVTPEMIIYDIEPRINYDDAPPDYGPDSWQGSATERSGWHAKYGDDPDYLSALFPDDAASLSLADIESISYWTKRPTDTPAGRDWWLTIYTRSDAGASHKYRFINNFQDHTSLGEWTLYSTSDTGSDGHPAWVFRENKTLYTDFTWDQIQTNYGSELLEMVSVQTDISWGGYDGYIDGIEIELTNDKIAQVNFVPVPVPGAVLLGMLGLSVAGVKLRKYA